MTPWQRQYWPAAVIRVGLLSACLANRAWLFSGIIVGWTIGDVIVYIVKRRKAATHGA